MTQWLIAIMLLKIIALRRIKILEPHAFVFFCAIYNTLFIDVFLFKLKCDPSKFLSRLRLILCFVKLNHAWKATAMQLTCISKLFLRIFELKSILKNESTKIIFRTMSKKERSDKPDYGPIDLKLQHHLTQTHSLRNLPFPESVGRGTQFLCE